MRQKDEACKKIRLSNAKEVNDFVKIADSCDFDINIGYDRIVIDGKSIVGVMGLDLGRELTVHYSGKNEKLERFLDLHAL